jgi:hypothetical protein
MRHRIRESSEISPKKTSATNKHIRSSYLQHRAPNRRMSMLVTDVAIVLDLTVLSRVRSNRTLPTPDTLLRFPSILRSLHTVHCSNRLALRLHWRSHPGQLHKSIGLWWQPRLRRHLLELRLSRHLLELRVRLKLRLTLLLRVDRRNIRILVHMRLTLHLQKLPMRHHPLLLTRRSKPLKALTL